MYSEDEKGQIRASLSGKGLDVSQLSDKHFDIEPYFGSQWMILRRDFIYWFVEIKKHKLSFPNLIKFWFDLKDYQLEYLYSRSKRSKPQPYIPDEIYFPTVLAHSPFRNSIPPVSLQDGTTSVHYVRMDEHFPWGEKAAKYVMKGSGARNWGPYYLGVYDLFDVRESKSMFLHLAH